MKKFEKNYIGKGKKHETYDIVTVTINMEEAEKHTFEYEGKKYLKFDVAALSSETSFGKTHTVYVNKLVEEKPAEKPAQDTKKKKTAKKQAEPTPVPDDLPF